MSKTAQQKFNDYMDECRETNDAINELTTQTRAQYGDYGYATGFLSSLLAEAIAELPKARRADFRNRLFRKALESKKVVDTAAV